MEEAEDKTLRQECFGKMFAFWALWVRLAEEMQKEGFTEEQQSAACACFARAVRRYAKDRGFFESSEKRKPGESG